MFSDFEEQCRYGADRIRDAVRDSPRERFFHLALSGGNTPARLYELLARRDLQWDRVRVYFVDERLVPPDSPKSNYALVRERLLDRAPIPEANIHPVPGADSSSAQAAAEYERSLASLPRSAGSGAPRFDLVLLGMGEDGHIGSLFPGSRALAETDGWAAGVAPEESPDGLPRVSLTLPVINSADLVLVHISGASKTEVLQSMLEGGAEQDLPISRVRPAGTMEWLLSPPLASLAPGSVEQPE
ncbi:MAG: 6-phosphogluconolactonase [Desulfohalobiaceae bacterium]